jgi:hypothetical protein
MSLVPPPERENAPGPQDRGAQATKVNSQLPAAGIVGNTNSAHTLKYPPQHSTAQLSNKRKKTLEGSLPFSEDMERGLLCALWLKLEKGAEVSLSQLSGGLFYIPAHRLLFGLLREFAEQGKPVDFRILTQTLSDRGQLEEVGGKEALDRIYTFTSTPEMFKYYLDSVTEKAGRRKLILAARDLIGICEDQSQDAQAIDGVISQISHLSLACDGSGSANGQLFLRDPEAWPEPVNGKVLIEEIASVVRRHVIMSEAASIATALWIVLTYVEHCVDVLPILAVISPQKRCGKSTLLSILGRLVKKPLQTSSVSPAALFRSIEKWTPTLLVDEADLFLRENEALRLIFNAGHTRDSASVLRTVGESHDPTRFSIWAPKAAASIGKLPETMLDRSIHISLERRTHKEAVIKLRDAEPGIFERLCRQAARWAQDHGEAVKRTRPTLPDALNDRAADNWFPLFQIATVAGFNLSAVRSAALALSTDQDDDNTDLQILSSLREIFVHKDVDFLSTEEIIKSLNGNKEGPWAAWKNGMTDDSILAR